MQTHSYALNTLYRTNLELIVAYYPQTTYVVSLKHPFYRLLAKYDVPPGGKHEDGFFKDGSHPYLGVDIERCVHRDHCVHICEEVQGQFIWEMIGRDDATCIAIGKEPTLLTTGHVSCGVCVDSCVSEALLDKWSGIKPTAWAHTTCAYCAASC